MNGFKEAIEQSQMKWELLKKIVPEKGGNKKEITRISLI
jgi:hypothetical protein